MPTSQHILPPHALIGGKYRLGPVIGSGGVGTVYRATHLWTEREVAVKILDPSLPHYDELREAFLREARATVQLEHPNVVEVLDMGEDDAGTTYLVMELLDGPLLRDVLFEQGRLSPDDTLAILLPLIDALETAHGLGIVHRDFKPENIVLSVDPFEVMTPKLLDFGVAQILRDTQPSSPGASSKVIVGTPQYMSPEQARDQIYLIGPQTDVWGVGVVWYECLTGQPPFDGGTPLEILNAVCEAPINFENIPDDYVPILRAALRRSPLERTRGLSVLRSQLEQSGLAPASQGADLAAVSSWPPSHDRPSYIRRTLSSGSAPSLSTTGARPVQRDSELLTLPPASHWKALLGGAALAIAVGLAAWWTIGGTDEDAWSTSSTPPPKEAGHSSEPVEYEATETALLQPEETTADPAAGELEKATENADSLEPIPSKPAPAAQKASRPKPKRPRRGDGRSSSSDRGYDKPPELVTEW